MANPNLKNLNSVYAKTSTLAITTTATAIVANNVSSSKVLKVSNVVVCNTTGNTATYTLDHYRNSTATKIAHEYGY